MIKKKDNDFVDKIFTMFESYMPSKVGGMSAHEFLQNPIFTSLMQNAPGVFCLLNFQTREYAYVSPNVKKLFGVDPEELYSKGISLTITYLPEEHQHLFAEKVFPHIMQTCMHYAPLGRVKDLRFSFTTFIKTLSGETRNFLHQITVVEVDDMGLPLLATKFIFDIQAVKKDAHLDYEVALYDKEEGCYQIIENTHHVCSLKNHILSLREMEILRMIGEGKSSKEIADMICLSRYTVDNHRKNMMRKFEVTNTSQLLNTVSKIGIL